MIHVHFAVAFLDIAIRVVFQTVFGMDLIVMFFAFFVRAFALQLLVEALTYYVWIGVLIAC